MRALNPIILAALALSLATSIEAGQVYRSGVELVRVDVSVTRNGRPVTGLGRDDFIVEDDGVVQRIEAVVHEQIPLEVYLVLDISASVSGPRLDALRGAASALIANLAESDEAAVLTFSHRVEIRQALTHDADALRAAVAVRHGEWTTAMRDAIYATLLQRQPNDKRAAIVVFSDAADNISWLSEDEVMDAAERTDVAIHAVTVSGFVRRGAGAERADRFLRQLAAATGGDVWEAKSLGKLTDVFVSVLERIRQTYLITYVPSAPPENGWHRIEVTLKGAKGHVTARRGYLR